MSRARRTALALALAAGAIACLLAAWAMSTRPFTAPDEPSHYLRAMTLAQGELLGPRAIYPGPLDPLQRNFVAHNARAARMPDGLAPPLTTCVPTGAGHCTAVTPTGSYAPPAYLAPAAVMTVAGDATTALWLSRLVSAALCAVLLVTALWLSTRTSLWATLGLGLALSPAVFFVCSILNSSSLEIAAAACFTAGVLRVARDAERSSRATWAAVAISGALTITSFQAGPLYAAMALLGGAGLMGRDRLRRTVGPDTLVVGGILLCALALWLVWGQVSGSGYAIVHVEGLGATFQQGLPVLGSSLKDAIGTFGSLTIFLPRSLVWAWWILCAALLFGALAYGSARERVVLMLVTVFALLAPIVLFAWVQQNSGSGLQGRYVLPLLMLIPMLSGDVLARRLPSGRATRVAPALLVAAAALLQGYAWLYNARANAGTPQQPHGLTGAAPFAPPLGWTPWIVLALAAVLLALAAAAVAGTGLVAPEVSPEERATAVAR